MVLLEDRSYNIFCCLDFILSLEMMSEQETKNASEVIYNGTFQCGSSPRPRHAFGEEEGCHTRSPQAFELSVSSQDVVGELVHTYYMYGRNNYRPNIMWYGIEKARVSDLNSSRSDDSRCRFASKRYEIPYMDSSIFTRSR